MVLNDPTILNYLSCWCWSGDRWKLVWMSVTWNILNEINSICGYAILLSKTSWNDGMSLYILVFFCLCVYCYINSPWEVDSRLIACCAIKSCTNYELTLKRRHKEALLSMSTAQCAFRFFGRSLQLKCFIGQTMWEKIKPSKCLAVYVCVVQSFICLSYLGRHVVSWVCLPTSW